ncbi:MAG: YlxM family DNA-binding protein, partial [Acutalibacteraceae bacterium]
QTQVKGESVMAKNLDVIMLFDIYGEMLTQKQQDFIGYYYNDDLSLAEIAENEGITRQGVRDAIKRAEAQLVEFEEHLGLKRRFDDMKKGLDEIEQLNEVIKEVNRSTVLSREINDATARIGVITQMLRE